MLANKVVKHWVYQTKQVLAYLFVYLLGSAKIKRSVKKKKFHASGTTGTIKF